MSVIIVYQGQATNVLYLGVIVFVQDKNDTITLIRLSIVKLLHLCTVNGENKLHLDEMMSA
jgi:hypothetical protein